MNCRIFIWMFALFVLPIKVIAHIGKVLEIVNMSLIVTNRTETKLCQFLQSEINNTFLTWCFSIDFNVSNSRESICKSTIIIYNNNSCNTIILNRLRNIITTYTVIPLLPEFKYKMFITFQWNKFETVTNSIHFVVDRSDSIITDTLPIVLVPNVTADMILLYRSRCDNNYYGLDCDIFCQSMDNDSGHYNCDENGQPVCLDGWRDLFCTEAICDECVNGQCLEPNKCRCYRGWSGYNCSKCQKAIGCLHGTCTSGIGLPFTCMCHRGWGGQYCDIDLKYCVTHREQCANNGTCYYYYGDSNMHYICKCAPGYFGRHCTIKSGECYRPICKSVQCFNELELLKCRCYSGFSGPYCQINDSLHLKFFTKTDDQKSNGVCVNHNDGYHCSCSRYKRTLCQCTFIKCLHNSRCMETNNSRVICSSNSSNLSILEFTSNFELPASSSMPESIDIDNRSTTTHTFLRFYLIIFIIIFLLVFLVVTMAIVIKYRYWKNSKVCIKTIHNDLKLEKNSILTPRNEDTHLLRTLPPLTSIKNDKCLRNDILTIQNHPLHEIHSKDKTWDIDNIQFIDKSRFCKEIDHSIVCNPNLLTDNYRYMYDSGK